MNKPLLIMQAKPALELTSSVVVMEMQWLQDFKWLNEPVYFKVALNNFKSHLSPCRKNNILSFESC